MYTNSYALSFHIVFIGDILFKYFHTNDRRISTWSYFFPHLTFGRSFLRHAENKFRLFLPPICVAQLVSQHLPLKMKVLKVPITTLSQGFHQFHSASAPRRNGEALINCEMMHERSKFSGRRNSLLGDSSWWDKAEEIYWRLVQEREQHFAFNLISQFHPVSAGGGSKSWRRHASKTVNRDSETLSFAPFGWAVSPMAS